MRATKIFVLGLLVAGSTGCIGNVGSSSDVSASSGALACLDTSDTCFYQADSGGCFVTGIGHIGDSLEHPGAGRAQQDSFGGNAMGMKDGSVRGEWQDTTHLGDVFHGDASWLHCWKDDGAGPQVPKAIPNNADFGGTGVWDHQDGYTFKVHAEDRAEPGHHADYYAIIVRDAAGDVIYQEGDTIDGGNFQIHPPNTGHPYASYMPGSGDTQYFAPNN